MDTLLLASGHLFPRTSALCCFGTRVIMDIHRERAQFGAQTEAASTVLLHLVGNGVPRL